MARADVRVTKSRGLRTAGFFNYLHWTIRPECKIVHEWQQERGFDGRRCAGLGAALLDAAAHVRKSLRGVPEPVFPLEDDAYVAPVETRPASTTGACSKSQKPVTCETRKRGSRHGG